MSNAFFHLNENKNIINQRISFVQRVLSTFSKQWNKKWSRFCTNLACDYANGTTINFKTVTWMKGNFLSATLQILHVVKSYCTDYLTRLRR